MLPTYLNRQLNTTIRILIDEDIGDPTAEKLLALPGVSGLFVRQIANLCGHPDEEVWDYAQAEDRIVVSLDDGFNRFNYPVCTHKGIIRFKTRKYDGDRIEAFKRFLLSGHRVQAKDAITYLYDRGFKIETHDQVHEYRYE